jgi:hypothetical protein
MPRLKVENRRSPHVFNQRTPARFHGRKQALTARFQPTNPARGARPSPEASSIAEPQ